MSSSVHNTLRHTPEHTYKPQWTTLIHTTEKLSCATEMVSHKISPHVHIWNTHTLQNCFHSHTNETLSSAHITEMLSPILQIFFSSWSQLKGSHKHYWKALIQTCFLFCFAYTHYCNDHRHTTKAHVCWTFTQLQSFHSSYKIGTLQNTEIYFSVVSISVMWESISVVSVRVFQ